MLESAGVSWISMSWSLFPGDVLITSQIIVVSGEGTERNITLEGNGTAVNITGLQSGTEYSIRVTAVASDGQTSPPSVALTASTAGVSGKVHLEPIDYSSRVEYNTEKTSIQTFYMRVKNHMCLS